MKIQERLENLISQRQLIYNQLATLENPSNVMDLIKAREQLSGAIEFAEALISETLIEEEPKEEKEEKEDAKNKQKSS